MCAVRVPVNSWNAHHKCQAKVGKYPVFGGREETVGEQMTEFFLLRKPGSKTMNDINEEQPFSHADTIGNASDP
jgi:hypothetical protein